MVLVVALAVVVFLQVFNRFVLKAPLAWSEDLAMLLFQWVVFLGAAIGVRRLRHFGIDLVVKKLPARMHRTIALMVPFDRGNRGPDDDHRRPASSDFQPGTHLRHDGFILPLGLSTHPCEWMPDDSLSGPPGNPALEGTGIS